MNGTEIYGILKKAQKMEARARQLKESEMKLVPPCGSSFEPEGCRGCAHFDACENTDMASLFEKAWALYHRAAALARRQAEETDSEKSYALLAQILMDIHIHPNSGLKLDTPELWESQYLWLKLYYSTKKEGYMDMARLCEGFRNASAKLAEEEECKD